MSTIYNFTSLLSIGNYLCVIVENDFFSNNKEIDEISLTETARNI